MITVSLACLFEILSVVVCLHYLYDEKFKIDLVTLGFIALDICWMNIAYLFGFGQEWSLIMYLVILIYCGVRFGFQPKKVIINNILCIGILMLVQASIIILFSKLLKIERTKVVDNLAINIIMFFVVVFSLKKLKLKKVSDILMSNEKLIVRAIMIAGSCALLFLLSYKQISGFAFFYYIVLGVSIISIVITSIDIGKHKIKTKEMEAELRLHKLYESSFQELIDEISARQHEFDNHINTIYSQHCLYKTYEELVEAQRKYCNEIVEENHLNKMLSKGNPVILGFLYSKFMEMEKKGIPFTYQINIGDLKSEVPIYKLVEILGNLIKNAVEELEKREKGGIYISLKENEKIIQIVVSNENEFVDEKKMKDFFKKGYSEKGKNRGFGLYNIGKICQEYDIAITCKNEEIEERNWLVFKLIINKPL